jgi:hypothetical protein
MQENIQSLERSPRGWSGGRERSLAPLAEEGSWTRRHSPKRLIWTKSVISDTRGITSVAGNGVSPPCLNGVETNGTVLRILEDKEDKDRGERASSVESSGKNV